MSRTNGESLQKIRLWRHLGEVCFYCNNKVSAAQVTVDHVFPRVAGYAAIGNLVPACRGCNEQKDADMPDVKLLAKVQDLYTATGDLFDPHLRNGRGMDPPNFWAMYCKHHGDPQELI